MGRLGILVFLIFTGLRGMALAPESPLGDKGYAFSVSTHFADAQEQSDSLLRASLVVFKKQLVSEDPGSRIHATRQTAFIYAQLGAADSASSYIAKYLQMEFRPEVLSDRYFDPIRSEASFQQVEETFAPQKSPWSLLYLYIGLMGLFIVTMLILRRTIDLHARLLIAAFVFIHSIFIIHIAVVITNYQFEFPHSYLMSTAFSFLYGPLLYFYFKRTVSNYRFKPADALHLIPTALILVYLIPVYLLSGPEKLELMLERALEGLNPSNSAYLITIVSLKLTSLMAYGWLIRREIPHVRNRRSAESRQDIWEQNVYRIHVAYICCYTLYGFLIINGITSGLFYHIQVVSMSLMVVYVGYFAGLKPEVFGSRLAFQTNLFTKYKKSGLTPSLSLELRDRLVSLMEDEKRFRENDLNLDKLSELLETTRHNTSQVINEHFDLSFHELLNHYRIKEAKYLLASDVNQNLHIIDVVYEVGYNNKVSFNKAFKKETGLTPSVYQNQVLQASVKRA